MFRISGDFEHPNGFNMMIMQSQEDTDKLIKAFENAINAGYNPNIVHYIYIFYSEITTPHTFDFTILVISHSPLTESNVDISVLSASEISLPSIKYTSVTFFVLPLSSTFCLILTVP